MALSATERMHRVERASQDLKLPKEVNHKVVVVDEVIAVEPAVELYKGHSI